MFYLPTPLTTTFDLEKAFRLCFKYISLYETYTRRIGTKYSLSDYRSKSVFVYDVARLSMRTRPRRVEKICDRHDNRLYNMSRGARHGTHSIRCNFKKKYVPTLRSWKRVIKNITLGDSPSKKSQFHAVVVNVSENKSCFGRDE